MHPVATFEFVLLLLVAVLGLQVLAQRLDLPPAAALIVGGIALAFVPAVPTVPLDPDLVLVLFLPPLLMSGAYFTVLSDFRRQLAGIVSLAVGAVAFTTAVVGIVVHWVVPELPWAACFALGAVVSPPDAVAAKAVLERVKLPRRLMALLDGESLLNDAAGIVLFRFAVAAALTGSFSLVEAGAAFGLLAVGGVAVGAAIAFVWVKLLPFLVDTALTIAATLLLPWAAYIGGEALHVSGVIATVTAGLVISHYQHELFSATIRQKTGSVWHVVTFLLEAFVFILIGLSLRGVIERLGGVQHAFETLDRPIVAVLVTVVTSRFVWIYGSDLVRGGVSRFGRRKLAPFSNPASVVMSWTGMRGVVTLAIALSLPDAMPGRDLILASAFAVILVTVLLQGTTIGPLIRLVGLVAGDEREARHLTFTQALARMTAEQYKAVEVLARQADGTIRHPRLLEQYGYRAQTIQRVSESAEDLTHERVAHFETVLAAVAAGRREVLRLYRAGEIHEELLRDLEQNLDLQEMTAEMARG